MSHMQRFQSLSSIQSSTTTTSLILWCEGQELSKSKLKIKESKRRRSLGMSWLRPLFWSKCIKLKQKRKLQKAKWRMTWRQMEEVVTIYKLVNRYNLEGTHNKIRWCHTIDSPNRNIIHRQYSSHLKHIQNYTSIGNFHCRKLKSNCYSPNSC